MFLNHSSAIIRHSIYKKPFTITVYNQMSAINNGSHHPFGSGRPTAVGIAHILIRSVLAKGKSFPNMAMA